MSHEPPEQERSFRAFAYGMIRRDGHYLFLRRSGRDRVAPNLWDVPGGSVEPGETILQCLRREIDEESGVKAGGFEPLTVYSITNLSGGLHYLMAIFEADHISGQPRLSHEHSDFRWATLEEAKAFDLTDPTRSAVAKLLRRNGRPPAPFVSEEK